MKTKLKKGDTVQIIGRRWFDRINGNTYHSAEAYVNNALVGRKDITYGYGDHYIQTGSEILHEHYEFPKGFDKYTPLWKLKEHGITVLTSVSDVSRKKDLEKGGAVNDEWQDTALKELREEEGNDALEIGNEEGNGYFVSDNGNEYLMFENEDRAFDAAVDRVGDDLENEPSLFEQGWLNSHYYISDTDKNIMAQEQGDSYAQDIRDSEPKRLIEEAGMDVDEYEKAEEEGTEDDLLDKAQEIVSERIREDWKKRLEDPIDFLVNEQGIYSQEDLLQQSFMQINVSEAAKDAVQTDGVAHFLSHYDGNQIDLPSGAVAYAQNKSMAGGGQMAGGGIVKKLNSLSIEKLSELYVSYGLEDEGEFEKGKDAVIHKILMNVAADALERDLAEEGIMAGGGWLPDKSWGNPLLDVIFGNEAKRMAKGGEVERVGGVTLYRFVTGENKSLKEFLTQSQDGLSRTVHKGYVVAVKGKNGFYQMRFVTSSPEKWLHKQGVLGYAPYPNNTTENVVIVSGGSMAKGGKTVDVWEKVLFEYPTIKDEYKEWVKKEGKTYDNTEHLKEFLSEEYPEILSGKMEKGGSMARGGKIKKGDEIRVLRGVHGDYRHPKYAKSKFKIVHIQGELFDTISDKGVHETFSFKDEGAKFEKIKKSRQDVPKYKIFDGEKYEKGLHATSESDARDFVKRWEKTRTYGKAKAIKIGGFWYAYTRILRPMKRK